MFATTTERIELYLEDGGWMTSTDNAETIEMFGTGVLPTPFLEGTPVESVVSVLQRLNPNAMVVVREAAAS